MRSLAWPRPAAAVLLGNVLGFSAHWASMRVVVPWLWAEANEATGLLARAGLVALTFILLAAPPVLIGALGAWLAQRAHLWVGLACGLWGFTLIGAVPAFFPIAPGVWYAPAVLILLSSTLGGYMLDLREQVRPVRLAKDPLRTTEAGTKE